MFHGVFQAGNRLVQLFFNGFLLVRSELGIIVIQPFLYHYIGRMVGDLPDKKGIWGQVLYFNIYHDMLCLWPVLYGLNIPEPCITSPPGGMQDKRYSALIRTVPYSSNSSVQLLNGFIGSVMPGALWTTITTLLLRLRKEIFRGA